MSNKAFGQAVAAGLTSKTQRRLWALVFLIGLLGCIVQSYYIICQYRKYPVIKKSTIELQIPLQFPSVTICTNIPCSLRCVPKTNRSTQTTIESPDSVLSNLARLSERDRFKVGIEDSVFRRIKNFEEGGVFYTNNLYYGNCMTFNGGTPGESNAAEFEVLSTMLSTQVHKKYKDPWRSRSNVLMVHEPHTPPVFLNPQNLVVGFPGDRLTLVVTKRDYVLKPLPYSSQCVERNHPSKKPVGFYSMSDDHFLYTMEGCLQNCLQNLTKRYCQCVQPKLTIDTDDLAVCHDCSKIPKKELSDLCGCKRPCRYSEYDVKVLRKSGILSKQEAEKFRALAMGAEIGGQTNTFARQMGLHGLTVKMGSYNVEVVREMAEYELETLLASIGGILGLYLGVSVLSLCKVALASLQWIVGGATRLRTCFSRLTGKARRRP